MRIRLVPLALALAVVAAACSSSPSEISMSTTTVAVPPTPPEPTSTTSTTSTTSSTIAPIVEVPVAEVTLPVDELALIEATAVIVFATDDPADFDPAWFEAGEGLREEFAQSKGASEFLGWLDSTVVAQSSTVVSDSLVLVDVQLTNPEGGQVTFEMEVVWVGDHWAVSSRSWCSIAGAVNIRCVT